MLVMFEVLFCFYLSHVLFVSGDFYESPDSGQHSAIRAMKWNLQNHVEIQKLGIRQQQGRSVVLSQLPAVSRSQFLLFLHIYVSCNHEEAAPTTGLYSLKMSVLKDKKSEEPF